MDGRDGVVRRATNHDSSRVLRDRPSGARTYTGDVDVVVSDPAKQYVLAHGGTVYVQADPHTCCSGTLTLLKVRTATPKDAHQYVSAESSDIDVRFAGGRSGAPHELVIELRGMLRPHLVAFWDGCAFKP